MESQKLTDEEIDKLAPDAQAWFARTFGAAPGGWTNEQVRTSKEFRAAITEIVRAVEFAHGIDG